MTTVDLTVVCANLGRGYDPGEYAANARRILERATREGEPWALLLQEIDEEPDPAREHKVLRSMLPKGSRRVQWRTREPIILSPEWKVLGQNKTPTMGAGRQINARLHGIGPERYSVSCVASIGSVRLAFANTHPHRNMPQYPEVQRARATGQRIFADDLARLRRTGGGTSGVWGADMNDAAVPRLVTGERVARHRVLDHLRYWTHPKGARIRLLDAGTLDGTIDGHDPLWARLRVSA